MRRPSGANLYVVRTGLPVSRTSSAESRNSSAVRVAVTSTDHPRPIAATMSGPTPAAATPPHTTTRKSPIATHSSVRPLPNVDEQADGHRDADLEAFRL